MKTLLCLATLLAASASSLLHAGPFTTGNLVISRTGDGVTAIGSAASQVSLVEYQTSGTPSGNAVMLPTQSAANAGGLTDSGSASSNGHLNRSADGRYLILGGYDAPLGTASVTGTTATAVNRNLARVGGAGTVEILAQLTDAFSANNLRSANSEAGSLFYSAGNPGLRYADASASVPTSSTAIVASGSLRDVVIASDATGAKFLLTNTNTAISVYSGFPTSTASGTSLGVTLTDAHAFLLLDRNGSLGATGLGGLDTLFVADGSASAGSGTAVLRKFEWSGSAWVAQGTATLATASSKLFGLTSRTLADGSVELFATTAINSNNSLVRVSDSAFGTPLSGNLSVIASAGSNYAFRGLAWAPTTELSISASLPASAYTTAPFDITLQAANTGSAHAQAVAVQLTLPSGLSYVSAAGTGFTASHESGVVTLSGGSINAGTTATLTVTVQANSAGSYSLPAAAAVIDPSSLVEETNEANNSSAATGSAVITDAPDLQVSVQAPSTPLTGPQGFDYLITASNAGLAAASDVTVRFVLPANGQSYASTSRAGFTVSHDDGVVTFSGGSLAAGASAVLTVHYTALTDFTLVTPAAAATIDPNNAIAESNEGNNSSTAVADVGVNTCDLTMTKAHNGSFQAGDPAASYTLTVSNAGSGASQGLVTITDTLPTGLTATSLVGDGWTIGQGSGSSVSATRSDSLGAGQSYPALTLTCSIALNTASNVTNTASVSGGSDHSTGNNSGSDTTTVIGAGPGVLAFGASPLAPAFTFFTVNEEAGSITLPILRTGGRTGAIGVRVSTADGPATAPADYTSLNQQLVSFADGEIAKSITIAIAADSQREGNHGFNVTLSAPEGGATLGSSTSVHVSIIDPDTTKPTLSILTPVPNARLTQEVVELLVNGRATDGINGEGLYSIEASLNGGPWTLATRPALPVNPPANSPNYEVRFGPPPPGSNGLAVRATDFRGNVTTLSRSFSHHVKRPLTLTTQPSSTAGKIALTPNEALSSLELTKRYTLTATPNPGYRWDHWTTPTGDFEAATLTFDMSEGLAITAHFVEDPFVPAAIGDFTGLIEAAPGVTASASNHGFIQVKLTAASSFTGQLKLDGLTLPITGALDNDGVARFGNARSRSLILSRPSKPGLILAFQIDLSDSGTRKLAGTLAEQTASGSSPFAVIDADRAAFDGKTPATSTIAATYTCALPPASANPQTPQGDGIGVITVTPAGLLSFVGTLADGTALTAAAPLSSARSAALHASLYGQRGAFGARVLLDEAQPSTDLASTRAWWFRPFITGLLLPQGWPEGLTPQLIGAKYALPTGESLLRDLDPVPSPNAQLSFTAGGLPGAISKPLQVSKSNVITKVDSADVSFTAKLTSATGRYNGSFTHSDGQLTEFNGIVLQKGSNRAGFGHFAGAMLAGAARLSYTKLPQPTLVISELMAKNVSSLTDEDGAFSDWIELYNPGSTAVDLTNWCLTDNDSNLTKWRFPAVTLEAKAFLVVFASSKNRRVPGSTLHTNFALSADGEYLALVRPDGVTIEQEFAPAFPALRDDESYGVNFVGATLATQGASARYLVPSNESLGTSWVSPSFNDASWRSGKTGLGFGITVPGMTVRIVGARDSFGDMGTLAQADALAALPKGHANILQEDERIRPSLNLLGEGADGHYDNNDALPLAIPDRYIVKATGLISIPSAGNYVFGLNSDDGGRIRINGVDVMVDDSNHGPEDHLSSPVSLTAGLHSFEVIMWEVFGGDEVEFYAAAGTATGWNDTFKLVGGSGGLAVFTTPLGSSSAVGGYVGTNVQSLMLNKNPSCYLRLPFTGNEVNALAGLTLNMRYNDGFVAWLNGTEVARRHAPTTLAFNSTATTSRTVNEALTQESIDLSAHRALLVNGKNILAVQALNSAVDDSTFLVQPELLGTGVLRSATAIRFAPVAGGLTATPGAQNGLPQFIGRVADTKFSVKRGFFSAPFAVAITCATPGAQIRYTLDGSTPSATQGRVYSAPLSISRSTVLRVIAVKAGHEPSDVDTQSYFFTNDLIRQQPSGAKPGPGWPADGFNGHAMNYGMDPAVVNSTDPNIGGAERLKQALLALPTMSLVTDLPNLFDATTGIYVNPFGRGAAWERPASLELIGDSNTPSGGFQINCGVRTRGGFSRSPDNPKHAFHFYFRAQYGDGSLQYPLFGSEGADTFERMDLRTSQNYSWSFGGDGNNTFIREELTRELQGAMGQPYSRCRYYHLYINGVYWGLFDSEERTEAFFGETYLGGDEDDFDVVKAEQDSGYITGPTDGNLDAWRSLWDKARAHATDPSNERYFAMQGKAADGATPTADPVLLDVPNLIDYMLLTFWSANTDGSTSAFLGDDKSNNWFGARNRLGLSGGFKFFAHDFEHALFDVNSDRTGPFNWNGNDNNFTYSCPMFLHHDLLPNAEYRMAWADRVQKHLFQNGALTPETILPRLERRQAELDKAILAESARWGDSKRAANEPPLTRLDWLGAVEGLKNFMGPRGPIVIEQLRADGLYPSFDAPTLSQHGGRIAAGSEVVISGTGTLYYTLNGADPRQIGGTLNPSAQVYSSSTTLETLMPLTHTWKYLGDGSNQGTAWQTSSFDDSAWLSGPAELGYGDGDETTTVPFIDTDAIAAGVQKNATTYFRSTFTASNVQEITSATLRLKYDDAAIVYVNGVEAVRTDNINSGASFAQFASSSTPSESAWFEFGISPSLLVNGVNTIAVEVHQAAADSSDISFQLGLSAVRTSTPNPLVLNTAGSQRLLARARNGSEWSALVDVNFTVFDAPDLAISNVANGTFNIGDTGKTFTLTVSNVGTAATNAVGSNSTRVRVLLPAGLSATGMTGTGWILVNGQGSQPSVERYDALAAGSSFPPITLTVDVGQATANTATSTATVTLATGDAHTANNSASTTVPVFGSGLQEFVWASQQPVLNPDVVNEEDGAITVTLLRRGHVSGTASVDVATANGTAKAPGDFDAITSETVTFADGETSKTVSIGIRDDSTKEGNEHFSLVMSNPVNGLIASASNVITIFDRDTTLPAVSILSPAANAKTYAVLNGGTINAVIKATDNFGVKLVEGSINGGPFIPAQFIGLSIPGGQATGEWLLSPFVQAGENSLTVRAVDYRGNVSRSASRSFLMLPSVALALLPQPGANTGSIVSSPALPAPGLAEIGKTYTFTANPMPGYRFDHWTTPSGLVETPALTLSFTTDSTITATFVPNPFVAAILGDYSGLLRNVPAVTRSNGNNGFLSLKLSSTGAFTGTLRIDGESLPMLGQFRNNGSATLTLPRLNKTPLQLLLSLDLNPAGTHQLTGTLSEVGRDSTTALASLTADLAYFDGRTRIASTASYKVRVPALPTSPQHPPGDGTGTLSIAANGLATLVLKLADGTAFTTASPLSEGMSTALYAPLYRPGSGAFMAETLVATPLANQAILSPTALWLRPVQPSTAYPLGWPGGVDVSLVRND